MSLPPETDPDLRPVTAAGEIDVPDDPPPRRRPLGSNDFPPTETEGWQWSQWLQARVKSLEAAAANDVRRWRTIRNVLTGIGGVALTALIAAFKLAYSSGTSSGVAAERERQSREVEAVVQQLRVDVARLTGELRSLVHNRSQEPDR